MVEYSKLVERLDYYYNLVTLQILQHQSLTHGLFPLNIENIERREGHIRDNVYCAKCIWTLSLAYRHVDNNGGRQYELERSAVKCMRGLLYVLMRQADKVETFKRDQKPVNAIHSKFNVNSGDVSEDKNYHHLQMDAVALYLIALCQMIASGLNIIFTMDEVHFIQNLVYYIERTYRTADFGMWGRGTRYNTGQPELHASSIGMVKAALEVINGFNLFGFKGTQSSVVYVDSDAHYRNKSTMDSLLPRESNSKKSDAALLAVIGFPAFAIDDKNLREEAKKNIITELEGKFGFKRFHCDGYRTELEDSTRPYYEKGELMKFESIENEWPMFYLYLALDAIFRGDLTGGGYIEKVEKLMAFTKYGKTVPMFYYVAQRDIEAEKSGVREVVKWPNEDLEEHFLWGQSLYLITMMLVEKLIACDEIDPIGRSIRGKPGRLNFNHRYSSFQVSSEDLVVQVCLISENRSLQANLLTYGIETQTPKELEPIVICPPHDLVQVYEELGANTKLGLSGRPMRPLGGLGTSKIYKILGKTVVTYPGIFDARDFYMGFDMCLLIEDLKTCLSFIRSSWNMSGRPTVCFFLRDHNFRGLHSTAMVDFMAALKTGDIDGLKVKLGKLQCLVGGACVEHLDYLREKDCSKINIITNDEHLLLSGPGGFESVQHPILITDDSESALEHEIGNVRNLPTHEIVNKLHVTNNLAGKMLLLQVIRQRDGPAYPIDDISVEDYISDIYSKACFVRNWSVVRQGASLLGKSVASMAPCITSMLVCGKQVVLGLFGQPGFIINEPLTTDAIKDIIFNLCMENDPREVSLQQEMVVYLGSVAATKPRLFQGMLKIRVGWIIEVMKTQLDSGYKLSEDPSHPLSIYDLYPNEIQQLLIAVLSGGSKIRDFDVTPRNMFEERRLEGGLNRVPSDFYQSVWAILKCVRGGIKVKNYHLPQQPTLNEMTADEFKFKILVEDMIQEATLPVERQILVEAIMVISTIVSRNSELSIERTIDLSKIVESAIELFVNEDASRTKSDFYLLPRREKKGSTMYFTRSFVNNVLYDSTVLGDRDENCCIS